MQDGDSVACGPLVFTALFVPGHTGNVFLAGEKVVIPLPDEKSQWGLVDYADDEIKGKIPGAKNVEFGILPVGFYRLLRQDTPVGPGWVSPAALERLKAPTHPPRTILQVRFVGDLEHLKKTDAAARWFL